MNLAGLEPCEHCFSPGEFGSAADLLADLDQGNDPVAVMLTCWELGSVPDKVSFANPGEIMVIQNPGGLVPPVDVNWKVDRRRG